MCMDNNEQYNMYHRNVEIATKKRKTVFNRNSFQNVNILIENQVHNN